ncbi:MAG TPA: hypothetical protein VJH68_04640 [Candidatus Nanoarchaeia archaeon]|nr:hypothetical protein [Candidatus Nanoarchaeia archaeon]
MKPSHLAINDEVSKEAVSQLRIFSMQKFRPKGRGFTPSEIFCIKMPAKCRQEQFYRKPTPNFLNQGRLARPDDLGPAIYLGTAKPA